MITLNEIKNKLSEIINLCHKYEFINVRIFKGFGGFDEKYFNVFVSDCSADIKTISSRLYKFHEELKELLNCGVSVLTKSEIDGYFLLEINKTNGSVILLKENKEFSSEKVLLELNGYFGINWEFTDQQKDIDEEYKLNKSSYIANNSLFNKSLPTLTKSKESFISSAQKKKSLTN